MNMESYIENYLNTSETVIFETKAPMDKEQTEAFHLFHFTKRSPAIVIISFVLAGISIILCIKYLAAGETYVAVTYFIQAAIVAAIPFIMIKISVAKTSKAPYYYLNTNDFKFFEEYYVNTDLFAITVIPYNMLVSVHESENYFFLYITDQQAHIIPKSSFIVNTPEEMRNFLYYKLKDRFTIHCKQ